MKAADINFAGSVVITLSYENGKLNLRRLNFNLHRLRRAVFQKCAQVFGNRCELYHSLIGISLVQIKNLKR